MTALLCEHCPTPAVRLVEVDSALDSSSSENATLFLCELHCSSLFEGLNNCHRHIMVSTQTEPDHVPDGMTLVRVAVYDDAADEDTGAIADWYDAHLACNGCSDAAIDALPQKASQ